MGLRGPAPLPAEIKERRGTLRADRDKRVPMGPPVDRIPCPGHIAPEMADIWDEQVSILAEAGVLREVDKFALEAIVISIHGWRECLNSIDGDWIIWNTITGGFKQKQAHPLIATMRGFQADYYRWCSKFGLTPSDRTAIGMQEIKSAKMMNNLRDSLGAPELKIVESEIADAEAVDIVDAEVVGEAE